MLKIEIEVCHNCEKHNWYPKHNSKRYEETFTQLTTVLSKQFPEIKIEKNYVPQRMLPVINKHLTDDTYYDPLSDEVITMPRVGAFEVTLFGKTIFSKLNSGLWPNVPSLLKVIKQMMKARRGGEDLDHAIQRYSRSMQKVKSNGDSLNRSFNSRSRSRGRTLESESNRAKSALRATQLNTLNSNIKSPNLFNIRTLNKTDSNRSEVRYSRAKTPEIQRPSEERSRSPGGRPSVPSTLYVRDKIRRESGAGLTSKLESEVGNSKQGVRNFRSQRYNFSKNHKTCVSEQSEKNLLRSPEGTMTLPPTLTEASVSQSYLTEASENSTVDPVAQEIQRLTSFALEIYENQLLIGEEQAKACIGSGDDKKMSSIQQSNSSTQDPSGSLSNENVLGIYTEELVNRYHSLSANNSLSSNLQNEISNIKLSRDQPQSMAVAVEGTGKQQSLQYLENRESLGPINALSGQENEHFLGVPDTFRIQNNKASPKFAQVNETPKYAEKKEAFQFHELQKTAQFYEPGKEIPNKEKIFPRRVSSRGSNRYQNNEDSDLRESSNEQESKVNSVGNVNEESGQLTFRNTSATDETVIGSNHFYKNIIKYRDSNDSVRIQAESGSVDFEETGDFNQIKYPDSRPNPQPQAQGSQFRKKKYNMNEKCE